MKLLATRKADQNKSVLDPWTVVHFGAGLAAGLVAIRFPTALAAAVAYEAVEQLLERKEVGKELFNTSGPETVPNALVDVAAFALGHELGHRWNQTGS
jgi:hypothetical protein